MKKFEDLSMADQKIKIVKDAIKQIKLGKILVTTGVYMRITNNGSGRRRISDTKSLKTLIEKPEFKCEACAKGALFASCVLETNEVYGNDIYNTEGFQSDKLRPWFSKKELDNIEGTFEGWANKGTKSLIFHEKYTNSKTRLLAILNNILKNKTFKP